MKKYWPFIGALGITATVGLYWHVSRDPLYEEPETEEEFFEEETEYETELPKEEIPVPKPTRAQPEKKQNLSKYRQEIPRDQHPTSQKFFVLDETSEEEFPWYYLPPEKREYEDHNQLEQYFNGALRAGDYKIAESYIDDILEQDSGNYAKTKKDFVCNIATDYYDYLDSLKEDCKSHDTYSVMRKVISMNSILDKYNKEISTCTRLETDNGESFKKAVDEFNKTRKEFTTYSTTLNLDSLKAEGEKTLLTITNCPKYE